MIEVSVVVVNWNSGRALAAMLESLERNPPSVPWEAVVVDNASRDGSADLIDSGDAPVRLIRSPRNLGLAAANNRGLEATSGAHVLIANPDVELPPGGVDALRACMDRHPRAAFVVPRLAGPDGSRQISAGDLPRLSEALLGRRHRPRGSRLGGSRLGGSRLGHTGFWWHAWPHDVEQRIGRGAEACYLVRRDAVADFGLQDPRFRLDWEGVEWTARARDAGWEVWFEPTVTVTHLGGVSISQAPLRWVVESHRGMYLYFRGRVSPPWRPGLAAVIALRAVLKLIAAVLHLPLYRWARVEARRSPPSRHAARRR